MWQTLTQFKKQPAITEHSYPLQESSQCVYIKSYDVIEKQTITEHFDVTTLI